MAWQAETAEAKIETEEIKKLCINMCEVAATWNQCHSLLQGSKTCFAPCSEHFVAMQLSRWEMGSGCQFTPNVFAAENGQKRQYSQFVPLSMDIHILLCCLLRHATFTASA